MKTIYIHIGPHKTGTTSIQKGLFDNKAILLQEGVLVADAGQAFSYVCGNHNLVWELRGDGRFNPSVGVWEDLIDEIAQTKAKKIIITSEDFSFLTEDEIAQIAAKLAGFQVFIVTYARRQDKFLFSVWSQVIKMGVFEKLHQDFDAWLERKQYYHHTADLSALLEKWATAFGKEQVIVRVLEKGQLQGTLFQDFLTACGIPITKNFIEPDNKNISPGIKTLVIIQALRKRLMGALNLQQRQQLYGLVMCYADQQGWNTQKANLIDAPLYRKIMDRFQESNQTVAREYLGREELFLEPFQEKEITRFSLSEFQPQELLDLFAFLSAEVFAKDENEIKDGDLENQYRAAKEKLNTIKMSRGWKMINTMRTIKRKLKIGKK